MFAELPNHSPLLTMISAKSTDSGHSRKCSQSRECYNVLTADNRYCFKFLRMCRRNGSAWFADFLPWLWPESVFLVLTKRKVGSGDENDQDHTLKLIMFFIVNTCLPDSVLKFRGELHIWSILEFKGFRHYRILKVVFSFTSSWSVGPTSEVSPTTEILYSMSFFERLGKTFLLLK